MLESLTTRSSSVLTQAVFMSPCKIKGLSINNFFMFNFHKEKLKASEEVKNSIEESTRQNYVGNWEDFRQESM